MPPVDALPPFQVRGEVFHVRLPASAVGSELSQRETTLLGTYALAVTLAADAPMGG